jgi:2-iminobutanoate/2-iminopropanoate deaminase
MFADSSTVFGGWEGVCRPMNIFAFLGSLILDQKESNHKGDYIHMRPRTSKSLLICLTIAMVVISAGSLLSYASKRRAFNVGEAKGLPFSDGVVVGNTLYIAGQEGTAEGGKLKAGGIGPETQAALDNIQSVLKAAGFELKDVVSVTVYLADIHEFGDMNTVYKSVMPDPKPARATIQAAALVNNARIEISAIAVKEK